MFNFFVCYVFVLIAYLPDSNYGRKLLMWYPEGNWPINKRKKLTKKLSNKRGSLESFRAYPKRQTYNTCETYNTGLTQTLTPTQSLTQTLTLTLPLTLTLMLKFLISKSSYQQASVDTYSACTTEEGNHS